MGFEARERGRPLMMNSRHVDYPTYHADGRRLFHRGNPERESYQVRYLSCPLCSISYNASPPLFTFSITPAASNPATPSSTLSAANRYPASLAALTSPAAVSHIAFTTITATPEVAAQLTITSQTNPFATSTGAARPLKPFSLAEMNSLAGMAVQGAVLLGAVGLGMGLLI